MRPSFSRIEIARTLDVDLAVVDALIESGRILCHVRKGETRIPIDQLEAFFRDSLVKLYRAEAGGASESVRPLEVSKEETEEIEEKEEEGRPEAHTPRPVILASPAPSPAPVTTPDEPRPELRNNERYVPLRQIDGIFGETKFSMLQLSSTGLRIRHRDPLLPGTEAKVSFALLKPARSIVVRARVVWTSIARSAEDRFSISGLRVLDHQERLARAIDLLKAAHELQPERRAQVRRATDGMFAIEEVSDDEIALVTEAVQKFAADPVEASRWYSRARYSVSDENVRRAAPHRPRDREEVLGIWEYLDRQVDIPKIAGIVGWMRQSAPPQ
jgi:PilZ domain